MNAFHAFLRQHDIARALMALNVIMSVKKNNLELTLIGKKHRSKLDQHILLSESDKSYHAVHRFTDRNLFDNRVTHGDNFVALKAQEQDFAGKMRCIFIDPPYIWKRHQSTKQDFLYTANNLSQFVVCSTFRGRKEGYVNLTVKKIPNAVLTRCEWGKEDYSLKVENHPKASAMAGQLKFVLKPF